MWPGSVASKYLFILKNPAALLAWVEHLTALLLLADLKYIKKLLLLIVWEALNAISFGAFLFANETRQWTRISRPIISPALHLVSAPPRCNKDSCGEYLIAVYSKSKKPYAENPGNCECLWPEFSVLFWMFFHKYAWKCTFSQVYSP